MILKLILVLLSFIFAYLFSILPRRSMRRRMEKYHQTMFTHRGYHCIEKGIPENSMSSFQAAVDHNYGIELDLHLTYDGHLVVFHDNTLDRICHCSGVIETMTLAQLKKCRLSGTTETIPLFEDVLNLVDGKVPLLIELKIPKHSLKICKKTYELLKNYHGDYLVQSFNSLGIWWFRIHAPEILRGQLSSRLTKEKLKEPWLLCFLTEKLVCNLFSRPDFISYKLKDLPTFPVSFLRTVFHTPVAVWTLRTREALKEGSKQYDMQIFEKHSKNY